MTVDPLGDAYQRDEKDCPNCGGTVIEPRSSDKWNCAQCARQWSSDEL